MTPHATRARYQAGCRCLLCRAANSQYETDRAAARKSGDWSGRISAAKTRKHILRLSRSGIGRRSISEASGIGDTAIRLIKSGRTRYIRPRTERDILNVTKDLRSAASLVPATGTWKLIDELLAEGFSKRELAKRLGCKTLQFGRDTITAKTERRVAKFYRTIMEGS